MVRRAERGVTLLELLVAMTLLAVVLVGLAASYPLAMFGVAIGGYRTTATLLANQCIDIAKNLSMNGIFTTAAALQTALRNACPSTTGFGPGFTRSMSVVDGDGTTVPTALRVVTVTVNFPAETEIRLLQVTTIVQ